MGGVDKFSGCGADKVTDKFRRETLTVGEVFHDATGTQTYSTPHPTKLRHLKFSLFALRLAFSGFC